MIDDLSLSIVWPKQSSYKERFADDVHSIHQFSGVSENHLHIRDDLYSSILAHFNTVNSPLPSASCNRHEKASAHSKKKVGRHGITCLRPRRKRISSVKEDYRMGVTEKERTNH